MRNLCMVLAALSIGTGPAFAQSGTAATAAPAEKKAGKQATAKRVCKRVADVNSLVARKVCRVVEVEADSQASADQQAEQRNAGAAGANE